jgi:hypothetical protein
MAQRRHHLLLLFLYLSDLLSCSLVVYEKAIIGNTMYLSLIEKGSNYRKKSRLVVGDPLYGDYDGRAYIYTLNKRVFEKDAVLLPGDTSSFFG